MPKQNYSFIYYAFDDLNLDNIYSCRFFPSQSFLSTKRLNIFFITLLLLWYFGYNLPQNIAYCNYSSSNKRQDKWKAYYWHTGLYCASVLWYTGTDTLDYTLWHTGPHAMAHWHRHTGLYAMAHWHSWITTQISPRHRYHH